MLHTLPQNPFVTRYTRPGMLPPLDPAGQPIDIASLTKEIRQRGGASIEGPHGTGKSTVLAAISESLDESGTLGGCIRLRSVRDAVAAWRVIHRATPGSFLCLDGWEVLGHLAIVARIVAWSRGVGLVVTSHRPTGFSCVVRTQATLPLLAGIVKRLPDHGGLIENPDLTDALQRHPGNIREALLDLYDRFEHRARTSRW